MAGWGRDRGLTNVSLPVEMNLWSTVVYRNAMATCSTIKVETATKARLMELKIHPRETFNDVIERLVAMAVDVEPLSDETLRRLDEAEADIRAGRFRPLDDAMRDLGLLE